MNYHVCVYILIKSNLKKRFPTCGLHEPRIWWALYLYEPIKVLHNCEEDVFVCYALLFKHYKQKVFVKDKKRREKEGNSSTIYTCRKHRVCVWGRN